MKRPVFLVKLLLFAMLFASFVTAQASAGWYPYSVEVWDPPFDMSSPRSMMDYTPLEKASKKWNICVSFPHMKDAYWMAVDYGVVEESKRQGVAMQLVEAGGYVNLNKQISQIEDCVASGADAVYNELIRTFDGDGVPTYLTANRAMRCLNAFVRYRLMRQNRRLDDWLR